MKRTKRVSVLMLFSISIIICASFSLGLWIKYKQLGAVSDQLIALYPLSWFAATIFQVLLFLTVFWLILAAALRAIDLSSESGQVLLLSAAPFLVFILSIFNTTLLLQFQLFVLMISVVFLRALFLNRAAWAIIKEPLSVLIFLILIFTLLFPAYSPLYGINPFLDTSGRGVELMNFEHQWEMAKAFDYSIPNFTHNGKLGGTTIGVMYFSELSSFLMLLFDIPIVDTELKYLVLQHMFFGLFIFGSYGMYLFLRYGLDLSFTPSLIGGIGVVFGNAPIISYFGFEYVSHIGDFMFLPWAFLFLKLGFKKNNIGLIGLAGLVTALGEYALASHPGIKILSYFFLNIYNVFLVAKSCWHVSSWREQGKLFLSGVIIFPACLTIGLAFRYLPMLDLILKNDFLIASYAAGGLPWTGHLHHIASFFFHYESMSGIGLFHSGPSGSKILFYTGQFIAFLTFAFIVYLFFRRSKTSPLRENDLASQSDAYFFFVIFLLILINAWWGTFSPYAQVSEFFGIGHIRYLPRLNTYLFFFALITSLYGLHFLCKTKDTKVLNTTFVFYIIALALVYFIPALTPVKPESKYLFFDGIVLLFFYKTFLLYLSWARKPHDNRGYVFYKNLGLDFVLLLLFIAGYSFFIKKDEAFWLMQHGPQRINTYLCVILFIVSIENIRAVAKTFLKAGAKVIATYRFSTRGLIKYPGWFSTRGLIKYPGFFVFKKLPTFLRTIFPLTLNPVLFIVFLLAFSFLVPFENASLYWLKQDAKNIFIIFMSILLIMSINARSAEHNTHTHVLNTIIAMIALVTFLAQSDVNRRYLHLNASPLRNTYISLRTAVAHYRNSAHDQASLDYLKKRWNTFTDDLAKMRPTKSLERMNLMDLGKLKSYEKIAPLDAKVSLMQDKMNLADLEKIEFYEKIAPHVDQFYLTKGLFHADLSPSDAIAPLVVDYYDASQYYLPDGYYRYFYGESTSGSTYPYIRPIGKYDDINSFPTNTFHSYSHLFPSIKIYFHLIYLYNEPSPIIMERLRLSEIFAEDYPIPTRTILTKIDYNNKFTRKLMNVIGMDYVVYLESSYPDLHETLEAAGFVPSKIQADSVRVKIFHNPYSYGRAYIAPWVQTIKPEENIANRLNIYTSMHPTGVDLMNSWPWAFPLQKDFMDFISKIPGDIKQATLIETPESEEYSPTPVIHSSASQINSLKILGTKAVFEVDAQEDDTWLVYNTAALEGWKAFSDQKELPIRKANLGFIGVKLTKGEHLVWMEYRPFSFFAGLVITLIGWVFTMACIVRSQVASFRGLV